MDLENVNDVAGEESEDSGHVVRGETSAVISTSEYPSCKFATVRSCQKMVHLPSAPSALQ